MRSWWGFGSKASVLVVIHSIDSVSSHIGRQQKTGRTHQSRSLGTLREVHKSDAGSLKVLMILLCSMSLLWQLVYSAL